MLVLQIITNRKHISSKQRGFTVIELTIATLIFSVMMILVIEGVLLITRNYYKGITSSNTQNSARNIINNISQGVQFNGGVAQSIGTTNSSNGFCVGSQRYSYLLGYQLVSGTPAAAPAFQNKYVLVEDTPTTNCMSNVPQDLLAASTNPAILTASSKELMGLNMRLSNITIPSGPITVGGDLYSVHVRVVYGDSDLLCSPANVVNSCSNTITMPILANYVQPDLSCKGQAGQQFCAVADLSTIIEKRIQ